MFRLDGQVAVVTGGACGIGASICELFCEAGALVDLWDVNPDGQQVAKAIGDGDSVCFQQVDVTSRQSVDEAVTRLIADRGRIEILINNAGVIRDRSFAKMDQDEWDLVINVNLNGLFNVTKAVVPYMQRAGYGRIVSASSINASLGAFGQTNYAATKAAVGGFTRSLCKELGKDGITVNAVAPGFIDTQMTRSMPEEAKQAALAQIPLRRMGTPRDMAFVYLFLASREAGYISGTTLHANGGAFGG